MQVYEQASSAAAETDDGGCACRHTGRVLQQFGHCPQHHCNPPDGIGYELTFTIDKRFPCHADFVSGIQQLDSRAVDYRKPVARRPDTRSTGHGPSGTHYLPPGVDGH